MENKERARGKNENIWNEKKSESEGKRKRTERMKEYLQHLMISDICVQYKSGDFNVINTVTKTMEAITNENQ